MENLESKATIFAMGGMNIGNAIAMLDASESISTIIPKPGATGGTGKNLLTRSLKRIFIITMVTMCVLIILPFLIIISALFIVSMIGPLLLDPERIGLRKGRFKSFKPIITVDLGEETRESVHPNETISPVLQLEVEQFEEWQLKKLLDKPALISTWQILPDGNEVKMHHWMKMKIKYIDNRSPKCDAMLFIKTFQTVLPAISN